MTTTTVLPTADDLAYEIFRTQLVVPDAPLFRTDATGLFDLFLENIPMEFRQKYTCSCCRRFVDEFGGLVTISKRGQTRQPCGMWRHPNSFNQRLRH